MKNNNLSILSSKDVLILQKLLEDGRASSSSISKEIDLGKEIVNYRIKRLIKKNLIVKFVPKINAEMFEYQEYTIFLKLNLEDKISKERFVKKTIGNKYLIWIIKSNDGWDLIIRLFAKGIDEFKIKLNEILELFSDILANYYTIITSSEITSKKSNKSFENFLVDKDKKDFKNIKYETPHIDKKDREIVSLLEENGRLQYTEIGESLKISSDTVKYRIEKLKNCGVLKGFAPVFNYNKLGFLQKASILRISYLKQEEEKKFEDFLKKKTCVTRAIKSLNEEEYFLSLVFENLEDEKKFIEELKNILGEKILLFEVFDLD